MIIDNLSLYASAGKSSDSDSSSNSQYMSNKPAYLNDKTNYVIEDYRKKKNIENMFIDKDGHLCKRNSTAKIVGTTGIIDAIECVIDSTKTIFYLDSNLKLYKCIYNDALGKYSTNTLCTTIPSSEVKTKNNIKLFFCDNSLYIVGGGIYYKYLYDTAKTSGSTDAATVLAGLASTAYIPLIKRKGSNTKPGQSYEDRNILTKQVRVTLNTVNTSSVFWLGQGIASIDKVFLTDIQITDWTWSHVTYNTSLTINRTFANNDEEPLTVYYTLSDEDKQYQNILNASNVSVLSYNGRNLFCLYSSKSLNISNNKLLTESDKPEYFKSGDNLYVSLHLSGNILNVLPLINNRFAIVTDTGITICSLHYWLDTNTKMYSYTCESDFVINGLNVLYNSKSTVFNNTIYCTLDSYNLGIIKIDPIYNKYTCSIIDISQLYDVREITTELSKYNGLYYNAQENHLHIYGSSHLVYDLNYNIVYIYRGLCARDKIIADDAFVDSFDIVQIYEGQYGIDNNEFYTGVYESKYLDLGNPTLTKSINKLAIVTESTGTATSATATITASFDTTTSSVSKTFNLTSAKRNVPITSCTNDLGGQVANSMNIKVNLPANIYKLDSIIVKRDYLTDLNSSMS